ncbi:MAG: cyclic nucleotide-binding domain-containing protein [Rhodospirillales bacterium]|nr:cyclic nucleotide-binding domain-containing protein [Rhodospirillales bacterium]
MQELVRKYHVGAYAFREGEAGQYAFIVRAGKIRLFRVAGPREIVLDELMEGRLFGESALVELCTRSHSAIATTGTECYAIDRRDYNQRLTKIDPAVARGLRNLHIFVHRVPLHDAEGRRLVGTVAEDMEAKLRAMLDSDFGKSLMQTGDALVDMVAEQIIDETRRRLTQPPADDATEKLRARLKTASPPAGPAPAPAPAGVTATKAPPAKGPAPAATRVSPFPNGGTSA